LIDILTPQRKWRKLTACALLQILALSGHAQSDGLRYKTPENISRAAESKNVAAVRLEVKQG
jgi:hypothetical protein